MLSASLVPAFPYEGALFWFFGEVNTRYSNDRGYYSSLYGPDPESMAVRAAALACLFEKITMAQADAFLPDSSSYMVGGKYDHPDLRLVVESSQREWNEQDGEVAQAALRTDAVRSLLDRHPFFRSDEWAQRHLLTRSVQQMRLAVSSGSTLIGDQFFHDVSALLDPIIRQVLGDDSLGTSHKPPMRIDSALLPVIGLDFSPSGVDAFATIRQTKEVSAYATAFRQALASAAESSDPRAHMVRLIREAMDHERVAQLAAGGFQTAGSVLNLAGLVPILGSATTIAGIGADASGRLAEWQASKNRWYLLGPKLKEIEFKDLIRKESSDP
jgi:hypothetical protein